MTASALIFIFSTALPQAKKDSIPSSIQSVYYRYMSRVGGAANLYNGAEYEGSYPGILGSPFNENPFQKGNIFYEGILYYDIPIAMDLVRNEVLTKSYQQFSIRLDKNKVDYFILNNHTYVHLRNDTVSKNILPDDIYELIFNKKVQLYAKRWKAVEKSVYEQNKDTIVSHTAYFVYKDKTYFPISSTKVLTKIFHEEKNAITAFWKEKHLKFKKAPETFIVETLNYWSELKK